MPEMTPLRNNPPQSLAQPMRQAYDYWQEVPWHKRKKPKNASLFAAKVINNARKDLQGSLCLACTPPPAGAVPRYYPYAKVISSARSDLRAACTPPHAGQVPAITRMQKLSTVRETHCRALFRGFRVYISIDKGQYCPRTTPSGWTAGHSLLVLLQSWHLPAAR